MSSAPATGSEIVAQLLALTPEPAADADAEHLLVEFEAIIAARAQVLAQIVPPLVLADGDRGVLAELERRQALWQDILGEALRLVGRQRHGTSQLRAYAQSG
jgi:hypothetical protein